MWPLMIVMAGRGPTIHDLLVRPGVVDARTKSGHDGEDEAQRQGQVRQPHNVRG